MKRSSVFATIVVSLVFVCFLVSSAHAQGKVWQLKFWSTFNESQFEGQIEKRFVESVKAATGVAFFQCGSIVVSLFPLADLAKDAGVSPARSGFGGFAIAYNTRCREDVDATLAEAAAAGAQIIKPAQDVFWGGYSGYFRDLDGHLWEVAWNPGFALDAHGVIRLPD